MEIGHTPKSCDPFGIPSTSPWTGTDKVLRMMDLLAQARFRVLVVALTGLTLVACDMHNPLTQRSRQSDAGDGSPDPGATDAPNDTATCDGTTCGQVCALACPDQLDQSCTGSENLGALINSGARFIGQTYTAGRTGTLSGVAISVTSGAKVHLRVSIRDTVAGLPGNAILGTTTLGIAESPLTSIIQFASQVAQVKGQQYAIVVDYPDAPPLGQAQGAWTGTTTNCYSGGNSVESESGVTWSPQGNDLDFKVFIKAN